MPRMRSPHDDRQADDVPGGPRRRSGPPLRAGLTAGVLVVAVGAAVAVAQSTGRVVVTDSRTDAASGAIDLTRVQLERASDGRLRAAVTAAADWTASDLVARDGGPPGSVCLRLYDRSDSVSGVVPDHLVCVTSADGRRYTGTVLEERPNALPRRVASARVTRSSRRSVVMRFSQSSVGRPDTIRFSAESTRPGCARPSCIDAAPNLPSSGRLKLREPSATTNRP